MPRGNGKVEFASDVTDADLARYKALKAAVEKKRAEQEKTLYVQRRQELLEECPHPLALAQKFDQTMVSTPAMELISNKLVETLHAESGRTTCSIAPQSGKSSSLRWLLFWALLEDPNRRCVFASYAASLARTSGRIVRSYIEMYGGHYGLTLDDAHRDASDWQLARFNGGVYSVGVGGALTGRPCDGIMLIDDPHRNMQDADSATVRTTTREWWESVARTRLAPGTPVIGVATRWNQLDLISTFIAEGWEEVNIPAVSDGVTRDALNRPPGEYLVSTRGATPDDWDQLRREVGERAWWAMAMGAPQPPSGGVFKAEWFQAHRITGEVGKLQEIILSVDPAETGTGDEAGIIVAGIGLADRQVKILADESGVYSAAEWSRNVCLSWLRWGAHRVVCETNLGLRSALPSAWSILRRQAVAIVGYGSPEKASQILHEGGDAAAADIGVLRSIEGMAEDIVDAGPNGPRVVYMQPRQSKLVRAESVAQLYETGRAAMVGEHKRLENQCTQWISGVGSASPDRVDAMVLATHVLGNKLNHSSILV